ncbi:hypothetical protein PGQ11_009885 [Apiospora arundinis]|uniref:2EXR domain-containing protein n=1 Tax=Apiospora arundinis TaxID=335852 RepID=A0ABR2I8I3_9PEZI
MCFPKFSELPTELQLEIWRFAMAAESRDRAVLLHDTHVVPRRQLCSPFLAVNSASRDEARRRYTVALEVVNMHMFAGGGGEGGVPGTLAESYRAVRSRFGHRLADAFGPLHRPRTREESAGVLYLSPHHDTFVLGLDFASLYDLAQRARGRPLRRRTPPPPSARTSRRKSLVGSNTSRYITESLPAEACQQIRNTVLAEQKRPGFEDWLVQNGGYTDQQAERLWRTRTFPGAEKGRHLWVEPSLMRPLTWGLDWELRASGVAMLEALENTRRRDRDRQDDIESKNESNNNNNNDNECSGGGELSRLNIRQWYKTPGPVLDSSGTGERYTDVVCDPDELQKAVSLYCFWLGVERCEHLLRGPLIGVWLINQMLKKCSERKAQNWILAR